MTIFKTYIVNLEPIKTNLLIVIILGAILFILHLIVILVIIIENRRNSDKILSIVTGLSGVQDEIKRVYASNKTKEFILKITDHPININISESTINPKNTKLSDNKPIQQPEIEQIPQGKPQVKEYIVEIEPKDDTEQSQLIETSRDIALFKLMYDGSRYAISFIDENKPLSESIIRRAHIKKMFIYKERLVTGSNIFTCNITKQPIIEKINNERMVTYIIREKGVLNIQEL